MLGDKTINKVMIADDNTFVRFLVKKWLEAEAQIIEAAGGNEVLDTYVENMPDILFLDIHMPGRNGKEILKDILSYRKDAYVIMLSADSMKENVLFAADNGAKAFITKPFTRETLHRYFTMCPTIRFIQNGTQDGADAPPPVSAPAPASSELSTA